MWCRVVLVWWIVIIWRLLGRDRCGNLVYILYWVVLCLLVYIGWLFLGYCYGYVEMVEKWVLLG